MGEITDIADHKRREEALREREEIYSAIVNQAADGIVLIDPETFRFIELNDAACHGFGYTREEFAAIRLTDIQATMTPQEMSDRIRALHETGEGTFENRHRCKNGAIRDAAGQQSASPGFAAGSFWRASGRISPNARPVREEIERLNRLYSALSELNQAVLRPVPR